MASDKSESPQPVVEFAEDGQRPYIDQYDISYTYRPGDKVQFASATPRAPGDPWYYISEAKNGQYRLADANGANIGDATTLYNESALVIYNPF